ncbi:MAG: bifunctional folylpolyglutamate synthase/dihydrofolate synthase [Anaerolineae bacterium]
MGYDEALNYLYSFTDYEKSTKYLYSPENFNLGRVERLLSLLDNPQRQFRSILIAGTKGKGSTAAMIASVLQAAGYRVGLYTQPHLHTYRERTRVDGELIPEADFVALVSLIKPCIETMKDYPGLGQLTTYELGTALTLTYFAQRKVDVAVLEVGMGGRLDATNVVTPMLSIITSISFDHTHILGDTLTKIAREKGGIIKQGGVVLSAPQAPEVMSVLRHISRQKQARLFVVGQDWQWEITSFDQRTQSFAVSSRMRGTKQNSGSTTFSVAADYAPDGVFTIPLPGAHQVINATTAIAAIELLRSHDIVVPHDSLREGLRTVRWPGRLEILGEHPLVIADGAHNADSAQKLLAALKRHFDFQRLILVLGMFSDKDIAGIVGQLVPSAVKVIVTKMNSTRAADPTLLKEAAERYKAGVIVKEDTAGAIQQALAEADKEDLICITGSLSLVAEAREWFGRVEGGPSPG